MEEPPKLGRYQWFCTKCGHVGRNANAGDFAETLKRAVDSDPRACVFPKSTARPPALEILAGSMPYIVTDRI